MPACHVNEVSLFACLADPTRLTILERLRDDGPRTVTDLVETTDQERTNVSHHLAKLRDCGLVDADRDGRYKRYRLAHPRLGDLLALGADLTDHIDARDLTACPSTGCC